MRRSRTARSSAERSLSRFWVPNRLRMPAKGGAVPVYFVSLLQRLGTGKAELGIVQASELVSVRGVELLGPFPTELQLYTILAAGIASNSSQRYLKFSASSHLN
jgi:hypothetical protein